MCLMCEHYVDTCSETECIESAGREEYCEGMEYWEGRTLTLALWRGIGEPCEHIKKENPDWREDMIDE